MKRCEIFVEKDMNNVPSVARRHPTTLNNLVDFLLHSAVIKGEERWVKANPDGASQTIKKYKKKIKN